MQSVVVLSVLFCGVSAQLAAWPASSFNPYYQSLLGPARIPVNSIPVPGVGVALSAIPAPPPVAAPVFAAPAPFAAPLPIAAPLPVAAPVPVPAAPFFAPAPVAPVAPVFAAPAVPVLSRVVPAYAPFATSAVFIGSNKAKTA